MLSETGSLFIQVVDFPTCRQSATKPASRSDDDDYDDDDYDTGKGKVPASEMRRSSRARKRAEAETKALREELEALKAEIPTTLAAAEKSFKKTLDELKTQAAADVTAVREGFDRQTMLGEYGISDDLGRKSAMDAYSALPEAGRPELKAQLDIWKDKPDTRPKTLGAYFAEPGKDSRIPGTAGGAKGGGEAKVDVDKMTDAEFAAHVAAMD